MDLDLTIYSRTIYTALDFLGDIGGLLDGFKFVGTAIMFVYKLMFGNLFESNLLEAIFKTESKRKSSSQSDLTLSSLKNRKPYFT